MPLARKRSHVCFRLFRMLFRAVHHVIPFYKLDDPTSVGVYRNFVKIFVFIGSSPFLEFYYKRGNSFSPKALFLHGFKLVFSSAGR